MIHVFSESCKDVSDLTGIATGTWILNGKNITIKDLKEENKYDVLLLNAAKLKIKQQSGDKLIFELRKK